MEELQNQFPATKNYTYLNTASSGLLSADLAKWRAQHDMEFVTQGSKFREHHKQFLDEVRNCVATFFGASPLQLALIPNFSFGLNTFLEGVAPGKKVLLLERDYPSINWAFEQRNFEICYAQIDADLEQNIEQAVTMHKPDIFAFSLVQYLNGIKIDMNFLKQLKAYHPELTLVADGTQYLGTEPFAFEESPIDVLGASAYKWLLAGYGNGIFLVKDAIQEQMKLRTIGFNSADATFGDKANIPFMKHFEPGHQDTLNYG
ncbi:MAG: aminotransferase class V-fold PLP-dependent enzyme, partial [Marinirhabdus sp.]|nr:aminotransferase class V-fold PLP-dependent enzyme [Marinirhabdus sp.]